MFWDFFVIQQQKAGCNLRSRKRHKQGGQLCLSSFTFSLHSHYLHMKHGGASCLDLMRSIEVNMGQYFKAAFQAAKHFRLG